MAIKAEKTGSIKGMKKSLKRGSGGGQWLKRIPVEGITVRFLEEPDQWIKYYEHYDANRDGQYYFPCSDDCEGCDAQISTSKRYLVNAVDTEESKVIPLVLPASLVSSLMKKYDRFSTIMDRNYDLSKEGTGMETEYTDMYDQPTRMKLDRFEKLDLLDVLEAQLSGGDSDDDEDDEDEDDKPVRKVSRGGRAKPPPRKKMSKPAVGYNDDEDEDEEDDDEDDMPRKVARRPVKKTVAKKVAPKKRMTRR